MSKDILQSYLKGLQDLQMGIKPLSILKNDIWNISKHQSLASLPLFSLNKSSGPITSVAIGDENNLYFSTLIGSCTSSDISYNRRGELIHLSLERFASPRPKIICRTLNGHYSTEIRETISNVVYSSRLSTFCTVDYGGNLALYNMGERMQSSIKSPIVGEKLNTLDVWENNLHSLIGWGGSGNNLYITMISDDCDNHITEAIPLSDVECGQGYSLDKIEFSPSDPISFCMCGMDENIGRVFSLDLKEMKRKSLHRSKAPLTAMNLDAKGRGLLLLGVQDQKDPIEIYDIRLKERIASIHVEQRDIDSLLWSPSGNLIASSETSDNSVYVHDFRFLGRDDCLLEIKGDPNARIDSMMGMTWSSFIPDTLLSGGYSGIVRKDRLCHGIPIISSIYNEEDLMVGDHINCINETENMTWVGCDSGAVMAFGPNKAIRELEVEDVY